MTMSKLNRNTHIEEFSKCADNATEGKHVNTPQISIRMPKTANGNPRFPSRSDGAEAGVVTGGYHASLDNN